MRIRTGLATILAIAFVLAGCDPVETVELHNDLGKPIVAWSADEPFDESGRGILADRVPMLQPGESTPLYADVSFVPTRAVLFRVADVDGERLGCISVLVGGGSDESKTVVVEASKAGECPTTVRIHNDMDDEVQARKAGVPVEIHGTALHPGWVRELPALDPVENETIYRLIRADGSEAGCIRVRVEGPQVHETIDVRVSEAVTCSSFEPGP